MSIDQTKLTAVLETLAAAEAAMDKVVMYLQVADAPTTETAHQIIDDVLSEYGCESPEGHIVASGRASAEPHEKGTGPIERGVPVVIDIYPRSKSTGYYADITRTVCVGTPSPELTRMYGTVLRAQEQALSLVQPGIEARLVHDAAVQLFQEADYATSGEGKEFRFAEGFVHSIGHGVGTDIHMAPHFGPKSTDVLKVGDVLAIEPGLYYHHIGGVRIEDTIVVTESGYQNLTTAPKQLQV